MPRSSELDEKPSRVAKESRLDSVAELVAAVLSGTNSSMKRHSSMMSPGATRVSSSLCFALRRMPCHAKESLGQGLVQQLLEVLVLAALASCPRLRRSENVGHHLCKL